MVASCFFHGFEKSEALNGLFVSSKTVTRSFHASCVGVLLFVSQGNKLQNANDTKWYNSWSEAENLQGLLVLLLSWMWGKTKGPGNSLSAPFIFAKSSLFFFFGSHSCHIFLPQTLYYSFAHKCRPLFIHADYFLEQQWVFSYIVWSILVIKRRNKTRFSAEELGF